MRGFEPAVDALGWALVHFVWQGTLAALLLAAALSAARPRSARLRYALASASLLGMAALPAATFLATWAASGAVGDAPAALGASRPADASAIASALSGLPAPGALPRIRERIASALPGIVAAWCLGVALLSVRWMSS